MEIPFDLSYQAKIKNNILLKELKSSIEGLKAAEYPDPIHLHLEYTVEYSLQKNLRKSFKNSYVGQQTIKNPFESVELPTSLDKIL